MSAAPVSADRPSLSRVTAVSSTPVSAPSLSLPIDLPSVQPLPSTPSPPSLAPVPTLAPPPVVPPVLPVRHGGADGHPDRGSKGTIQPLLLALPQGPFVLMYILLLRRGTHTEATTLSGSATHAPS